MLIVSSAGFGLAVAQVNTGSLLQFLAMYWIPGMAATVLLQIATWLLHKWRAAGSFSKTYSELKVSAYAFAGGKEPVKPGQ